MTKNVSRNWETSHDLHQKKGPVRSSGTDHLRIKLAAVDGLMEKMDNSESLRR